MAQRLWLLIFFANTRAKKWVVLNGLLKDKDHKTFIRHLKPITELAIVTEPDIDRAEEGEKIFCYWEAQGSRALLVKDRVRALALARLKIGRSTGLLVTGSLIWWGIPQGASRC